MKGILRKGLIIGVGTAFLLKKKSEKLIDELLKQGKINPHEAEKAAKEFFNLMGRRINEISEKFLCAEQINELKQRLNTLEEKIVKGKV